MTAVAAEADPYLLPAPAPGSPVVLPERISPANPHPVSRYQDLTWSLAPLIDNPGVHLRRIHWEQCPPQLRGPLRQAAWAMINGELRPTYLQTRGSGARGRSSATTIYDTCREWMRLARWLHERGITGIAACARGEWRDYAAGRVNGVSRDHAVKILGQLTDLWAFDQLTACPSGITRPPWENEGADGYLPAAGGAAGGENMTEPLAPQVIGPLLVWAIRVVEDFSDDILAAWAENRRLTALAGNTAGSAAGKAALEAYLLPLVRSGAPLPAVRHKGTFMLARTFIAATACASPAQLDRFQVRHGSLTALAARQPGPCPLGVPVTGQVNGRPWREHMDFGEAPELMRHLGTAAAVVCLYLTGMRAQEVQGLRTGCCPTPDPAPGASPGGT